MTKLLMVGDVHVSDRPPSTRTESYRDDILRKLVEIGELGFEHEVDATVFVGDIFHSKKPRNTSHQTVRAVGTILAGYGGMGSYILPGNHDYAGRNVDSLARHPLGTLSLVPNVRLFGTTGLRSVMVGDVILHGIREEEGLEAFALEEHEDGVVVVVAHSAIFPPGEAPKIWEAWDATEVRAAFGKEPELVWYGHIHEPHGIYEMDGIPFVNLGAISRGSLHETGALERTPEVGLLEVGPDVEVTALTLKSARPALEVFRIAEVTAERAEASETNTFVEALSAAEIEVFSVERAISALSEHPGASQPVRDRAVELVREVS